MKSKPFLPALLAAVICLALSSGEARAQQLAPTAMIPASFAEVAEKASPAVVNISTVKTVDGRSGRRQINPRMFPGGPDDFFDNFFFGPQPPYNTRPRKEASLGSGFIFDPAGLIITNNHVVEGADDILVRLSDGQEIHADIIGRDVKTDLALIKLKKEGVYPFLKLGDSEKIRIGDWVVAIGNPFGLDHTVTVGILSGRSRSIGAGPYDDFLQTDASINFGNSGGPLLNLDGEVVGINTAIVAGSSGIGFAIPAGMATNITAQLRDNGRVVRGWIGVYIQKVTADIAKVFGLKAERGVLVGGIAPGGPAEKAGLTAGDIILSFDGKELKDWQELPILVAHTTVGKKVKLVVFRDRKQITVELEVAELPDDVEGSGSGSNQAQDLGLRVRDISPELAVRLGLDERAGVLVETVDRNGPVGEAGIQAGDVILEINRTALKNVADYRRVMNSVKAGETVLFLIRRGDSSLFFTMEMPKG